MMLVNIESLIKTYFLSLKAVQKLLKLEGFFFSGNAECIYTGRG